MAEQPGGGLATSTTASTTMKGANNPLSSIAPSRTSWPQRCYSGQCPNPLPRRDDGSTVSSETSRPSRYSRPKFLPLDGAGAPRNYPQHRLSRIERPRFVPSLLGHRQLTRPLWCTTASVTNMRRKATMMWSTGDGATTTMGPPEATTRTEAVATTVGRTAVLLLGHLALESSARPSVMPPSWPGFGNRPTSQSIAARPTPSCGWPITAWLVS
jgi:hypothetical protein